MVNSDISECTEAFSRIFFVNNLIVKWGTKQWPQLHSSRFLLHRTGFMIFFCLFAFHTVLSYKWSNLVCSFRRFFFFLLFFVMFDFTFFNRMWWAYDVIWYWILFFLPKETWEWIDFCMDTFVLPEFRWRYKPLSCEFMRTCE